MGNFKLNISYILKSTWVIISNIFALTTIILSFISWEDIKITDTWMKLLILSVVCIVTLILDIILVLFFLNHKEVWKKGKNEVKAMYSDLFKIAFNSYKSKRIIVIPVNDTFETIIEEPGEGMDNLLVTANSNHGRWIKRFLQEEGIDTSELNNRIQEDLGKRVALNKVDVKIVGKGNNKSYPIGSIAVIEGKKECVFYLLAISKFDETNKAQSSRKVIRDAVDSLLEFYDKNGQGFPMYLPLMGTGRSRADLTHEQSFKLIKSGILTHEKSINGEINIVVYKKDKDKVSIFNKDW